MQLLHDNIVICVDLVVFACYQAAVLLMRMLFGGPWPVWEKSLETHVLDIPSNSYKSVFSEVKARLIDKNLNVSSHLFNPL